MLVLIVDNLCLWRQVQDVLAPAADPRAVRISVARACQHILGSRACGHRLANIDTGRNCVNLHSMYRRAGFATHCTRREVVADLFCRLATWPAARGHVILVTSLVSAYRQVLAWLPPAWTVEVHCAAALVDRNLLGVAMYQRPCVARPLDAHVPQFTFVHPPTFASALDEVHIPAAGYRPRSPVKKPCSAALVSLVVVAPLFS